MIGYFIGLGLGALLYICAWDNAKQRKIGLSIISLITMIFGPLIGSIVALCSKRIAPDKKKKPTPEQRLPYEHIGLMYVDVVLFFLFGLLGCLVCFFGAEEEMEDLILVALFSMLNFIWGIALLKEVKVLKECKKDFIIVPKNLTSTSIDDSVISNEDISSIPSFDSLQFHDFLLLHTTTQYKIDKNGISEKVSVDRTVKVAVDKNEQYYTIQIVDSDSKDVKLNTKMFVKERYSEIDECLTLRAMGENVDFDANIFYKDGKPFKCVIIKRSTETYIHYCSEN